MDKKQEYEAMKEKTIASKEVFKGVVLDVFDDEIQLPNGKKSHREVIRHCQAAAILAINEKGEVLLEDQYRYPYDAIITEIPAGKADPNEEPLTTAKRELEEETGYQARKIQELGLFYPSVGYTDEAIHLFLAEDLYKTHQHLDDGEMLNYYFLPLDEVLKKVRSGEINDGKKLAALLHYVLLKKNN